MTIKLLTPRGTIPALAIVTLDAATETALVADKVASVDLTGGTVWTGPVDRSTSPAPQAWTPSSVSGDGSVTITSRDGLGRVTNYTRLGVTYVVTYGSYGIATQSGGGSIWTYNYDASGLLTSVVKS